MLLLTGLKAEKQHEGIVKGIEGFDKNHLQHTQMEEKNPLPDKDSRFQHKVPAFWAMIKISMYSVHARMKLTDSI